MNCCNVIMIHRAAPKRAFLLFFLKYNFCSIIVFRRNAFFLFQRERERERERLNRAEGQRKRERILSRLRTEPHVGLHPMPLGS